MKSRESHIVVPLVGTWIEISLRPCTSFGAHVVPLVGTWIEMQILDQIASNPKSRSPCGNVD